MRSLVAKRHHGKSDHIRAVACNQGHGFGIGDQPPDALRTVFPPETRFDEVARHQRQRERVAAARESQDNASRVHARLCHGSYRPVSRLNNLRSGERGFGSAPGIGLK